MRNLNSLILVLVSLAVVAVVTFSAGVASVMGGFADALFTAFKDKNLPLQLAAGILGVGLALAVGYLGFLTIPIRRRLKRHANWIQSFESRASFEYGYERVNQTLGNDPLIGHAWKEFSETLHHDEETRNTFRPHAFINTQHVQEHNLALKLMPHLPNYFVGVGLLLTFAGLVAALNFATQSVGGDVGDAVSGLENLLGAATFKFWTSIAGLGVSIFLSFAFRIYANLIERSMIDLCNALEARMHFATPQKIFADMLEVSREQLTQTKQFNTETAFALSDRISNNLNEQLPQHLSDALAPMTEEVKKTSDRIAEQNNDNVGEMVEQFSKSLEGGAGSQMQAIAQTLENLQQTLSGMQGSVDSTGDQFAQRMAEGTERLESTMRQMSESVAGLVDQLRGEFSQASNALTQQLEETLERISKQSEQAAAQLAAQGDSASRQFAANVETAAQSFHESARANAEASSEMTASVREELQARVGDMATSVDKLNEQLRQVDSTLAGQADAFGNIVAQGQGLASQLENSTTTLREGVRPWQAAGQQLADTMSSVEQNLTTTSNQLQETLDRANRLSETLQEASTQLQQTWDSYRQRFESVDEDLEKAFQRLSESVASQQQQVQDFTKELDSQLSRAVNNLNGTVDGIQSAAGDLQETLEEWVEKQQASSG
jgi:chromosome segregation ATPase